MTEIVVVPRTRWTLLDAAQRIVLQAWRAGDHTDNGDNGDGSSGSGSSGAALATTAPVPVAGAAAIGVSSTAARSDHAHLGVRSFASRDGVVAPAAGDYVASHITNDSTVSGTTLSDALDTLKNSSGSGGGVTLSSATPTATAAAGSAGSGTTAARADHVHAHGLHTDGALHAGASTTIAGFLSSSDKTKLDGIAAGATVGPTLSAATPASVGITNSAGSATTAARADHAHAHGVQSDGSLHAEATTSIAGFLSSSDKTKLDGIASGATVAPALASTSPASIGTSNTVGTSSSTARADHVHAHGAQTDGSLHAGATTSIAGFLSAADKTKLDGIATGATVGAPLTATSPSSIGTSNTVGTDSTAARADHVHAHGTQTDGTLHAGATTTIAGFLSAADKTKLDGIAAGATVGAPLTSTSPQSTGTSNSVGVATTAARADHVHAHGALTDGTLHAVATTSVAGFLSAADKTKLDSLSGLGSAISADTLTLSDQALRKNTATTGVEVYAINVAGQRLLAISGANSARYRPQQSALAYARTTLIQGGVAQGSWGLVVIGSCATSIAAANFTGTGRNVIAQQSTRLRVQTGATANNAGWYTPSDYGVWRGTADYGGFFAVFRVMFPQATTTAAEFFGFTVTGASPAGMTNTGANTQVYVGFACDSGGSIKAVCNGAAGGASTTPTVTDSGLGAAVQNDQYEGVLYCAPGASEISWQLRRISGSGTTSGPVTVSGTFTTNLPTATTVLVPTIHVKAGAAAVASLDVIALYVESAYVD